MINEPSEFDRIAAKLELTGQFADLAELEAYRKGWADILAANPERPGDAKNLAVIAWVGVDIANRLPFVFNALGLRRNL